MIRSVVKNSPFAGNHKNHMPFFAIFVVIPMLEILVFMSVGDSIGFLNTLAMALMTAIIGGWIVKLQGLGTLMQIKSALGQGKLPLNQLFDGLCLIASGAMLITPGFVTDGLGFALLIPPVRTALRHIIKKHTNWSQDADFQGEQRTYQRSNDIIDADFEDITPDDKRD